MAPKCQPSSQTQTTFMDIHVLLVDDDATSLAIVSTMLRICRYQVETVKNPLEALDTLRARKGKFDLVVTDFHMPQMNGLQLQQQVKKEFKLPVIMMSADEKPSVILKSLEEGVALYMVKPISLDDLKHIWQYAITAKKVISNQEVSVEKSSFREASSSASSPKPADNDAKSKNKNKKKKTDKKAKENGVNKSSVIIRKPKVVWTNSLHNRFLQAIKQIGLDKAVPKRILEFMNVPGLTRENVASHLQKYRIFLKRVAERGACSLKTLSECRLLRSSFASGPIPPSIHKDKFQSPYPFFRENHQMGQHPLNYGPILGGNFPCFTVPNPGVQGSSRQNSLENELSNLLNHDPNLAFMESETTGFSQNFNHNGKEMISGEDNLVSLSQNGIFNLQASNYLSNGGFCFNEASVGCMEEMISDTNLQTNTSVLLPMSDNNWEETNKTTTFEGIGQNQECFGDVLREILVEQNQPSSQEEKMVELGDFSDIWNEIELDHHQSKHHQTLTQEWDDGVLEYLFGDSSS